MLFCASLVLLMTPALAMFYSGMVRSKNVLNTIMNCFIVIAVLSIQWVLLGYTLAFGSDIGGGILGSLEYFALENIGNDGAIPHNLFMIFQMMFAIIAAAIITGAFVERMKFGVLVIFIVLWSTFVYDPLAHWVWNSDGWLLKIGSLDFAGGGVVHISAGIAGLVGCIMLGRRKKLNQIAPHSIPYTFLGGILLWIGWLGFNAGSALGANEIAINAFITTNIATASGILGWVVADYIKHKKPTLLGAITGAVAGLVSITPAAGFVTPLASIPIGFCGAILCFFAITFLKNKLKYDDSLDVFGLHGVGGIWGGIATGLFATSKVNELVANDAAGEGLFYSGDFSLLGVQIIAILACAGLSLVGSIIIFKIISLFTSIRVESNIEESGLDSTLHGEIGYRGI
ncbi:ammonium transporter [Helicobacter sp. 16-1353]|uniref:ammonium transporter n=1 Tax=Helicobacter sp. 16-1353 TaxID=2004996 RepID=UPI00215C72E5|nr:ammonium transporter [Helicobacter sp. 16-1353]